MLKKGDRVKCIENDGYSFLEGEGRVFTIERIYKEDNSEEYVELRDDRGKCRDEFYSWRFEKIEPKKGTCEACNSNCKKDKICGLYLEE
jgi:hypothetical protein